MGGLPAAAAAAAVEAAVAAASLDAAENAIPVTEPPLVVDETEAAELPPPTAAPDAAEAPGTAGFVLGSPAPGARGSGSLPVLPLPLPAAEDRAAFARCRLCEADAAAGLASSAPWDATMGMGMLAGWCGCWLSLLEPPSC